jgi:hypothetical protein
LWANPERAHVQDNESEQDRKKAKIKERGEKKVNLI